MTLGDLTGYKVLDPDDIICLVGLVWVLLEDPLFTQLLSMAPDFNTLVELCLLWKNELQDSVLSF